MKPVELIYEQMVKPLPIADRLRLVEKIVHEITSAGNGPGDWNAVRGAAAGLLGEDAQQWVSRSRKEADERRHPGTRQP